MFILRIQGVIDVTNNYAYGDQKAPLMVIIMLLQTEALARCTVMPSGPCMHL